MFKFENYKVFSKYFGYNKKRKLTKQKSILFLFKKKVLICTHQNSHSLIIIEYSFLL